MSCVCQAAGRCRHATIAKVQRCCSHHGGSYAWTCTGYKLIMQLHMFKSSMHNLLMHSSPKGALRVHDAASAIANHYGFDRVGARLSEYVSKNTLYKEKIVFGLNERLNHVCMFKNPLPVMKMKHTYMLKLLRNSNITVTLQGAPNYVCMFEIPVFCRDK